VKSRLELCELLRSVTYRVIVQNSTAISAGSGVMVNSQGWLLTAKHVVGRKVDDKGRTIIVCGVDRSTRLSYTPIPESFVDVDMEIPTAMRPLNIDLVMLRPEQPVNRVPHIPLRDDIPAVGTDVTISIFGVINCFLTSVIPKVKELHPDYIF
jgi:hypothetical protein